MSGLRFEMNPWYINVLGDSFHGRIRPGLFACLMALATTGAAETPQYGGTLNVGTVVVTLSALSWDPIDWTWKANHDYGMIREQLFSGNLEKSIRKGGHYSFHAEAYLPTEVMRGELAESWGWEDDQLGADPDLDQVLI